MNIRIPSARVPLIDQKTGLISREWFTFFSLLNEFIPENIKFTSEGGFAVRYVNKTGAVSVKGYCVRIGSVDNSVILVPIGEPDGIGVFLEDGIPDGAEAWVVTKGKAYAYFSGDATAGHLARTPLASDTGEVSGQLISEAYPTSPFATDKHFCEMGHVVTSRTGAGLALIELHQN